MSERYTVAFDTALAILERIDTMPGADVPARLASVVYLVLDAIYDAEMRLIAAGELTVPLEGARNVNH